MSEWISAMTTGIEAWLLMPGASVVVLFFGVILLSYLLEDLAIVTAATLASSDSMPVGWALFAIFVGISSGDLGLYWLGKAAQRVRLLKYRLLRYQRARAVRRKLHQQAFITLFVVRFVPGFRTLGFTLSGFLDVPKTKFLVAVLSATALWTALIFGSLFYLGNLTWLQQGELVWLLIPIGIALMWGLNRFISKTLFKDAYDTAR